jgi:hypothetical protein
VITSREGLLLVRQHLRDQARQNMGEGELLLWFGGPDPRMRFTAADAVMIPFGLGWTGFSVFWEYNAIFGMRAHFGIAPALGFTVFGIPFLAIGLYLLAGRFFFQRYTKARTGYAITTRRAIIIRLQSLQDRSLREEPVTVHRSLDSRHASVIFGKPDVVPYHDRDWEYDSTATWRHSSTGHRRLAIRQFEFSDVPEPDAMLQALATARPRSAT